jgi:hypothetical protein
MEIFQESEQSMDRQNRRAIFGSKDLLLENVFCVCGHYVVGLETNPCQKCGRIITCAQRFAAVKEQEDRRKEHEWKRKNPMNKSFFLAPRREKLRREYTPAPTSIDNPFPEYNSEEAEQWRNGLQG